MEIKTYQERPVLAQGVARLIPPNDNYPDSLCSLVMTEENFFVLERRYNGTYEEYFNIPVQHIVSMEIMGSEKKSGLKSLSLFVLGLFGGLLVTPGGGINKSDYMMLEYENDNMEIDHLRFNELDSGIQEMVKKWKG